MDPEATVQFQLSPVYHPRSLPRYPRRLESAYLVSQAASTKCTMRSCQREKEEEEKRKQKKGKNHSSDNKAKGNE